MPIVKKSAALKPHTFRGYALCALCVQLCLQCQTLGAAQAVPDKCSNLKATQAVVSGNVQSIRSRVSRGVSYRLPAFCRVIGVSAPVSDSQIGFEVWMPAWGWNRKFQAGGNHNLGGIYYYGDMGTKLKRNFAVASTDTGHVGNDAEWGAGHPEKVKRLL